MFGLVAFTVERRTKEIGVRKVLGATVGNVVTLLSKEFVTLVAIGNLIAWPIAYWIMSNWLKSYAYHTGIGISIFVRAGMIALVVAVLAVIGQAVRGAGTNPVISLKYQ
jgi:putative ABC transport system permease protein